MIDLIPNRRIYSKQIQKNTSSMNKNEKSSHHSIQLEK